MALMHVSAGSHGPYVSNAFEYQPDRPPYGSCAFGEMASADPYGSYACGIWPPKAPYDSYDLSISLNGPVWLPRLLVLASVGP